eukprot:EG_transcript_15257
MADDLSADQKLGMSLEEIIAHRQRHGGEAEPAPRRPQPSRPNLQRLQAQQQQRQQFQRPALLEPQPPLALTQTRLALAQQPSGMLPRGAQSLLPSTQRGLALAGQPQVVHVPVYVPVPVPASMAAGLAGLPNSSPGLLGGQAIGATGLGGFRGAAQLDSPLRQPMGALTAAQQGLEANPFTMSGTGFRVDANGQFVSNYQRDEPVLFSGPTAGVPAGAGGRAARAAEAVPQRANVTALPTYEDQAAARRQQYTEQQAAQRQQRRAAGVAAARANPAELEARKAAGELTLSERFAMFS